MPNGDHYSNCIIEAEELRCAHKAQMEQSLAQSECPNEAS